MRRLIALLLAAAPAAAAPALPSGLEVTPFDVREEVQPGGETWLVLRYLAPAIAGGAVPYEEVVADLDALCAGEGLAAAERAGGEVAQIVIVLMDRPVERGTPDADAVQYIGAYLPIDGACEWE